MMVNKKSGAVGDGDNSVVVVDTSVMEVDNNDGHEQDEVNAETVDNNSEQVTQELTLTDHLNKKLLEAFLSRINTTNDGQAISSDTPDDSTNWVDETT